MDKVTDYLPESEILAQLAEEAAELAQAALKLRRALDGTNPTPKCVEECKANLLEEIADVSLCACLLMTPDTDYWTVHDTMAGKRNRWLERLKEKEGAGMAEYIDKQVAIEVGTPKENNMRYCPYCGAKMDLEDVCGSD